MTVQFPEWIRYPERILGTSMWFIGRMSNAARAKGYEVAISGKRYMEMRHQHRADCLALWPDLDATQRVAVALAFGGAGHDPNPKYNMNAATVIVAAGFTVTREA